MLIRPSSTAPEGQCPETLTAASAPSSFICFSKTVQNCSLFHERLNGNCRKIAITLKSMTPDEQLNELVSQRPELRPAIEASRHFWQRVFIGLAAIASVVILVILASALGLISLRFAVLFCAVIRLSWATRESGLCK